MLTRTKFQLLVLAIIVVALAIIAPSAFAQDDSPTITTFESRATNIRTGPGFQYTVRGVVYGNATFDLMGRNDFATGRMCNGYTGFDMWLQIDYNGVEGWVARCVVNINGVVDDLTVVEAGASILTSELDADYGANTFPTTLNNTPDGEYVFASTRYFVNLRDAPSLTGNVLDVISSLDFVYVTGRTADNSWLFVEYDGFSGWVAGYLLMLPNEWQEIVPIR